MFPAASSNSVWRIRYPSEGVLVQLIQPLSMSNPTLLQDGSFQFSLTGSPGGTWNIETSTNLIDWARISTNDVFSGTVTFTDTNAPLFDHRFYRADIPE
jgi:hypothetical protein